ncbi:hypothetical protein C8Q76DRAFT_157803 [Earliella scabrosa]|nr:hypothetical protein C8Q76DRAFT_157803 [Earliella scabrosa]
MSVNIISLRASEHPVKSVTIYQSSTAEVTRTLVADLQVGRNTVEIAGISSQVDDESPRVHGLGAMARLFDISCSFSTPPRHRNTQNLHAIKKATAKRSLLSSERNLRQEEYDMLNQAGKSFATSVPEQYDAFLDNVVRRKRAAMKAVWEYDQQIEESDDELWSLRNNHAGEAGARIVATLLATRECHLEFQLTYLVTGVQWQPHYDLHASTSEGKPLSGVTLQYCASISQSTGEDWNDTTLTLSTANSQALKSLSVPIVSPLKVSPVRDALILPYRSASLASGESDVGCYDVAPSEYSEPGQSTSVDRNSLSLAYRVEGAVSLPSDGVAHRISLATLDFSAELKLVCVPRQTTSTYIEGTIKNTSAYELLAGPVSVFMDDGFVTKTSLGLIGVNESFNCVLGVATALKVSYSERSTTSHEPSRSFAEPTKTTTRTTVVAITNNHPFDISELIVRDGIPLGDSDANIKVMLRRPEELAHARDGEEVPVDLGADVRDAKVRWSKVEKGRGGEKDGTYEWVCRSIAAGKEVKLEAEWDIKSPANLRWEETQKVDPSE